MWLQKTSARSVDALLRAFGNALSDLWTQTLPTLGPVTLDAITDRVFTNAAERFPFLTVLADRSGRFRRDGLHLDARLGMVSHADLTFAVRAVLVELLALFGLLTAEVLTPQLHAELVRAASCEEHSSHAVGVAT